MKTAFFEIDESWQEDFFRGEFTGDLFSFFSEPLREQSVPANADFEAISVFVGSKIDAAVLEHLPHLKFIATRSAGFDHIDITECKKRGIAVAYVPGYGDHTVAEFTFGLILSLSRKIYAGIDRVKELGDFSFEGLRGFDLFGKKLGVVGTGRIGKEVIKIAKGFGMEVVANDLFKNNEAAATLGFAYVNFDELLASADIVTFHCPLTPETRHLLNRENILRLKPGACVVNTSRGGVIETSALILGFEKGILGGVALDVLEAESEMKNEKRVLFEDGSDAENTKKILENHLLMKMPNVLMTPHMAFNSREALEEIFRITVASLRGFAEGKSVNLVP